MFDDTGPLATAWQELRSASHQLQNTIMANSAACKVLQEHNGVLEGETAPSRDLLAGIASALPHYLSSDSGFGFLATTSIDILNAVQRVNECKHQVKLVIRTLREHRPRRTSPPLLSPDMDTEHRAIADAEWGEKSTRTDAIVRALSSAGLGGFHLNKVYQPIRVLPSTVERAYWSWQAHQHRIRKINAATIREQINYRVAQQTLDIDTAERWRDQLKDHEHRPLRRIQWLAPALRLQYSFRETPGTPLKRNKIAGAGFCVLHQNALPTCARYTPMNEETASARGDDIQHARQSAWEKFARKSTRRYQPVIEALDVYTL